MNIMEFVRIGGLNIHNIHEKVRFEGLEHFDNGLKFGKGVVLVTAHFGNWEYLGASLPIL